MTPRELNLHLQEYGQRVKLESEERIIQAWLSAYWNRVKKMPSLKEVLKPKEQKKPKNAEELLSVVKALNAQFGGTVEKKSARRTKARNS